MSKKKRVQEMFLWLNQLYSKWPDFIITFIGVFAGSLLSILTIKWQMSKETRRNRESYLTNLLFEFENNISILRRVQRFLIGGPHIDHLWSPAEVNANYLRTDAWDELVKASILPELTEADIRLFRLANRTVRDAKRLLNEISANWLRLNEWHKHDKENNNQPLTSRQLYKDIALRESTGSVDYAIKELEKAILRIKDNYSLETDRG